VLEQCVQRPADKEKLIARLVGDSPDALFSSVRDLFVFAAALGKAEGKSVPPAWSSGDPIRLELFQRESGHELLIHMLAVLEHRDDLEILEADRVAERVAIFERYVNGGLEIIQAHFNANRQARDDDALQMLVSRYIDKHKAEGDVDLARYADELGF
jgi:dnd system-associated protein 4